MSTITVATHAATHTAAIVTVRTVSGEAATPRRSAVRSPLRIANTAAGSATHMTISTAAIGASADVDRTCVGSACHIRAMLSAAACTVRVAAVSSHRPTLTTMCPLIAPTPTVRVSTASTTVVNAAVTRRVIVIGGRLQANGVVCDDTKLAHAEPPATKTTRTETPTV